MHLNISQLNKEVQEQGPELQFRTISAAKPIEAGASKLSQQLTHTHLLQTSHLNHLLRPTFFIKCFSWTQKKTNTPLKVSRSGPVVLTESIALKSIMEISHQGFANFFPSGSRVWPRHHIIKWKDMD